MAVLIVVVFPCVNKVLRPFFSLPLQNIQHRKYARWKATYIHNCLKSGETPEAGPSGMDPDVEAGGLR